MRTRLEASLKRLTKGLGPVSLQAAKTAVAAGFAYYIAADLLNDGLPVFAPLTAVLTVQVTVWDSVSKGLQRALGVVVGVLVAYALARVLGVHVWSVALVVFVSWVAGQVIRIGQQGAVQVPISALLVLLLGASTSGYATDRVVETFLGAGVGILVSLVAVPRTNLPEARAALRDLAVSTGTLLSDLAGSLLAPGTDFSALLARAEQFDGEAQAAAMVVEQTLTSTRWSLTGYRDRPAAERLVAALRSLDDVARAARGMTRTLADAATPLDQAPEVAGPLADLLRSVLVELKVWTDVVTGPAASGSEGASTGQLTEQAGNVTEKNSAVLTATGRPGVDREMAATADAVAVYGLRINEDLRTKPGLPPSARASWRSLFGP